MSKNRGHNSAFFITTLSVYLGLVLVGASPSVLAQQAALTQRFEVRHEIDVEDDLDKKPGNKDLVRSSRDFDLILKSYSVALSHFAERASFSDYRQLSDISPKGSSVDLDELLPSSLKTFALEKPEIGLDRKPFSSMLEFKPGSTDLVQFSAGLDRHLEPLRLEPYSRLEQEVLRSALAESENDQVFVVTSLPRGSLDSLVNGKGQVN